MSLVTRQANDKLVGNEFDQPTAGLRRETGCLSFILMSLGQVIRTINLPQQIRTLLAAAPKGQDPRGREQCSQDACNLNDGQSSTLGVRQVWRGGVYLFKGGKV
ncbi:hypothetical protein B4923_16680 [Brenneria roseae subsp. americana]|uniref:Uncharacterized protein n=1 Tax=Brenneria roseae subsp. americana TaxID=1508507 RepID=A0A2U1TLY9_9GAMM|nr:hypothetical protein B4923_16680 [Brenneria roseae subsp. americana]